MTTSSARRPAAAVRPARARGPRGGTSARRRAAPSPGARRRRAPGGTGRPPTLPPGTATSRTDARRSASHRRTGGADGRAARGRARSGRTSAVPARTVTAGAAVDGSSRGSGTLGSSCAYRLKNQGSRSVSFTTRSCTTRGSSTGASHSRPASMIVSRCSVCVAVSTSSILAHSSALPLVRSGARMALVKRHA